MTEPMFRLTFGPSSLSPDRLVDLLGVPDGLTREQAIAAAGLAAAKVDDARHRPKGRP